RRLPLRAGRPARRRAARATPAHHARALAARAVAPARRPLFAGQHRALASRGRAAPSAPEPPLSDARIPLAIRPPGSPVMARHLAPRDYTAGAPTGDRLAAIAARRAFV